MIRESPTRASLGRTSIETMPDGTYRIGSFFDIFTELTTDGGASWKPANLQSPVLPRAYTRFRFGWHWDGREAALASRCTDDTGYTQPPLGELIAVRGTNSYYHNNAIQTWKVAADGTITNGNRA